jgi:hypothetical protein
MAIYPFLSPEWIEAARQLRAQHEGGVDAPGTKLRMNLTIEDVPAGGSVVDAHVDTTNGLLEIDLGHITPADVKVTLPYATARAVLIDNNAEAAMGAFMAGRLRVEGDMTKLLAYQSAKPTRAQVAAAEAIKEITAP